MTIAQRLRLAVSVASAVAIIVGITGIASLTLVGREFDRFVREGLPLDELNDQMLQALTDAETAQRGFLITGQGVSLERFEPAVDQFRASALAAWEATDDAVLHELVEAQLAAGERWITEFAEPVVAQFATDPDGALERSQAGDGRVRFEAFRAAHDRTEQALLARTADAERVVATTTEYVRVLLIVLLVVAVTTVLVYGWRTSNAIVGPLEGLRDGLRRLRGDGGTRVAVAGPPEVREVAVAVNDLAETNERFAAERQQVVDRLRELDQQKSDFVATVSHELRTPLTSIIGYLEMLADGDAGELGADQLDLLGVGQRNADRLLALIEDLLTLSRIESGTLRRAEEPLALGALVTEVAGDLAPRLDGRDLQLDVDVAADLPPVCGDRGQLTRVLDNLIGNALKFTPDGGRVQVRATVDGAAARLEVIDTGIGIAADELPRLFERFYRATGATDRAIPGTGLGLAITRLLIEQHGGTITVTSEPGSGTTFTVHLPLDQEGPT